MQERIALEELNKDLAAAQSRIENWASTKVTSANGLKQWHAKTVEEYRGRVQDLQAEQDELAKEAEGIKQRLLTEREAEDALKIQTERVEAEARQVQQSLDALQLSVSDKEAALSSSKTALAAEKKAAEKKLAAVHQALQLFQQQLGLHFAKSEEIEEELRVVFTYIDPHAHDKEFVVGVRVQSGDEYKVTTCLPLLEDIEQLQSELNRTSNFGWFVQAVRRGFQQTIPA